MSNVHTVDTDLALFSTMRPELLVQRRMRRFHKHSRDYSTRLSVRPLHGIVEMKQYQQDYNSTLGPTTVQTPIISKKATLGQ